MLQYFIGVIFTFVFGICCYFLCFIADVILKGIELATAFYLIFYVACPLGAALGMSYLDKWIFKQKKENISNIIAAFFLGVFSVGLILWFLPTICNIDVFQWFHSISGLNSDVFIFSLPVIMVLFSLIGYNAVDLFRKHQQAT